MDANKIKIQRDPEHLSKEDSSKKHWSKKYRSKENWSKVIGLGNTRLKNIRLIFV